MEKSSGVILIIVAIFLAYLGASGKYKCFTKMFLCITGKCDCECNTQTTAVNKGSSATSFSSVPSIFQLPPLPRIGENPNAV